MTEEQREWGLRLFNNHQKHRPWNEAQLAWLQEVMRNSVFREIGVVTGHSVHTLSVLALRHGLKRNKEVASERKKTAMVKWHKSQKRRLLFGLEAKGIHARERQFTDSEMSFRTYLRRKGYEVSFPEENRQIIVFHTTLRSPRLEARAKLLGYEIIEETPSETTE